MPANYNLGTGLGNLNPYEDIIYADEDNKRIGINKENPTEALDVGGNIRAINLYVQNDSQLWDAFIENGYINSNLSLQNQNVAIRDSNVYAEVDGEKFYKYTLATVAQKPLFEPSMILFPPAASNVTFPLLANNGSNITQVLLQDARIDYEKWIMNGPFDALKQYIPKDENDEEGWFNFLTKLLAIAGLAAVAWKVLDFLSNGAFGQALLDAAEAGKQVLCTLKGLLGLGGCEDEGDDGKDGADGQDGQTHNVWVAYPRVINGPLAYFRNYSSIQVNPWNNFDTSTYYATDPEVGVRHDMYFKTSRRVYITDPFKFLELDQNRETNRATFTSSMRWNLFDFPERRMNIETISFDQYDRTYNAFSSGENAYTGYSQASKAKIDGTGLYKVTSGSSNVIVDIPNNSIKNVQLIDIVCTPTSLIDADPVLRVNGKTIIDSDGYVHVSRIKDDSTLQRVGDGEFSIDDRAFQLPEATPSYGDDYNLFDVDEILPSPETLTQNWTPSWTEPATGFTPLDPWTPHNEVQSLLDSSGNGTRFDWDTFKSKIRKADLSKGPNIVKDWFKSKVEDFYYRPYGRPPAPIYEAPTMLDVFEEIGKRAGQIGKGFA
jgi:hypothetical protein